MIRVRKATNERGESCGQPPMLDGDFCFWHDPDHQAEAAEARRLGGQRRRCEGTVSAAYEVGELDSVQDLRRLLQIAVVDTLSLDNSIARSRTLGYLTQIGAALVEKAELAERLTSIETALGPRLARPEPVRKRRW